MPYVFVILFEINARLSLWQYFETASEDKQLQVECISHVCGEITLVCIWFLRNAQKDY